MSLTSWKTPGGLFSVQSGWSMLSTRVQPGLFNDKEGFTRIRRLLLDIARGPAEVSRGLDNDERYEVSDSNRLDPYQVGITILSAYANAPLGIFSQLNSNWKYVSLADCIHACAMESHLFFPPSNISKVEATFDNHGNSENAKEFMQWVLAVLVFIRDNESTPPDQVDLANRLLSFCSIARISPQKNNAYDMFTLIKNFFNQKGRLIHISLHDVHKAAKFLCLNQRQKWGWSVIVTVCFEKAVDEAYRNTKQIFGGKAWLLSRTPGRALFFHKSSPTSTNWNFSKVFSELFHKVFLETLLRYCEEIDTKESREFQKQLSQNNEISKITSKMIELSHTSTQKKMSELAMGSTKYSVKTAKDDAWNEIDDDENTWVKCLEYPAARGLRRFRSIQSLWQDLIALRGKDISQKVRPQSMPEKQSFVYLDCIQLGEILWKNDENWLRCFEKARIIAPIIEGTLAAFISSFDTLYPGFAEEQMLFGPQALGGDELHIIVPCTKAEVQKKANDLAKKLGKHLDQYGLAHCSEWVMSKRNDDDRLKLKRIHKTLPTYSKQMWWFGVIELTDVDNAQELINDYSNQITASKNFIRSRWSGQKNTLFHPM